MDIGDSPDFRENRLLSVTDNADCTGAYTYSADGLRLRVQESNNPNPDRWMQYDGVRPVAEGTLDGDTFTWTQRYQWEGSSYYDALIFTDLPGVGRRHYVCDGLGSTRQILDGDQNVTDSYTYEAFGNLMGCTGTTANPYRYVGSLGYYATGWSLLDLAGRYYMPGLGRFFTPGSPYSYAGNRPTTIRMPDAGRPKWTPGWKPFDPRHPYPTPGFRGPGYDPKYRDHPPRCDGTDRGTCARRTWDLYSKCIASKENYCTKVAAMDKPKFEVGRFHSEWQADPILFDICMNNPKVGDCWALWGEAIQRCMAGEE